MDYPPPSTSSSGSSSLDALPIPLRLAQPDLPSAPDFTTLVEVLRQALASGARSTESILRAAVDAARVLSGADGAAIALRNNGLIVCRARSGEIAPELGAPLNVDSGISGECLRTASILVCNDAATDTRVDPDVCLALGVRSIIVVPLRGAKGIVGILEAFSTHTNAFAAEQIDSLRALAEIAETAYDREFSLQSQPVAPTPAARIAWLFAGPSIKVQPQIVQFSEEVVPKRRYWIAGVAVIALLLISSVIWLSWREPGGEFASTDAPPQSASSPDDAANRPAPRVVALKPEAGVVSRRSESSRPKDLLQNAADVESANVEPTTVLRPTVSASDASSTTLAAKLRPALSDSEPPPSVEVAPSDSSNQLASLGSANPVVPAFGASVSTGLTEANLIHKVSPVYPQEARLARLSGSVILDATIAEDGSVGEMKVFSGPPLLAAAATEAVRQWRYSPSQLNGKPIQVQKRITIIFKLP